MKTIVVGYDDTEPAKRALARAAELATCFGAKVIVTSVAPVLVTGHGVGPTDPLDPPEEHRRDLMHAAAFLTEHGVEGEFDLALAEPAEHIVQLAGARGADLIVVGTTEPGLLTRLLGMSVSDKVERKAHCDVMVVH
jgi:nucleotide-binding universal stress UspA family protein